MWSANLANPGFPSGGLPSDFTLLRGGQRYQGEEISKIPDIPALGELKPNLALSSSHFLEALLIKNDPLTLDEIASVRSDSRIDLSIKGYESGAVPASANPATSYFTHVWTRDSVYVAFALLRSGHNEEAIKVITSLAHYYGNNEQRERMLSFHFHENPFEKYRRGDWLPMIRSPVDHAGKLTTYLHDSNGKLLSNGEHWGHAQLDAIGEWLWATFRFANQGRLDLKLLDKDIGEKTNAWNHTESVFVVATRFLHHIKAWEQHDLGPWEEKLAPQRDSSLGMIKAALNEMRTYFKENGWDSLAVSPNTNGAPDVPRFKEIFNELLSNISFSLDRRIPEQRGAFATESDSTYVAEKDAALALLLYPFETELTPTQEANILRSVYTLMGEIGFCRYRGDEYVGQDYIKYGSELKGKADAPGYKEAEWCIFDPILAGYYFRRFEDSGGMDKEAYLYGQAHLKRALAQITTKDEVFKIEGEDRLIHIPAGTAPEAYFFDSHEARWRPNSNSPLNWTKSVLAMALSRAESATKLYEAGSGQKSAEP